MKSNNPRQMQEVRPLDVQAQDTTALAAVEAALKSSLDECSRLRQQLSEVTGRLNATRGECNSRRPLTAAAYSTHRMTPAETEWCRQRLRPCMPEALARVLRQPQAKAPDAQVEKEAECCEGGGTMVQVGTMRPLSGRVQRITSFIGAEPFDCVSVMRRSHSNSLIVYHTVSPVSESLSSSRKGSELKRRTSSRAELLASFAPPAAFPYQNELFDPSSSFVHRLVRLLQEGYGTTALTLTQMSNTTKQALRDDAAMNNLGPLSLELSRDLPMLIMVKDIQVHAADYMKTVLHENQLVPPRRRWPPTFTLQRRPGLLQFLKEQLSEFQSPTTFSTRSSESEAPDLSYSDNGHQLRYFITDPTDDEPWVRIDLRPWLFVVSAYSLASYHPVRQGPVPRNWRLEGSPDGVRWHTLKEHKDDDSLSGNVNFGCWYVDRVPCAPIEKEVSKLTLSMSQQAGLQHVEPADAKGEQDGTKPAAPAPPPPQLLPIPFSVFRVVGTGPNAFGGKQLQISALELYGRLLFCCCGKTMEQAPCSYFGDSSVRSEKAAPARPLFFRKFTALPPEPVAKKKGKKAPPKRR